ncbi:MAG TPA: alanine--tRNA ligase, partial [Ignisphaera sp.]|nr:alanine--tRNA ligase [Ignisphaera sp.]
MFQRVPYTRMQCKYCRTYFWSMRKRDDCGDAPCTDYTFFDIPTKRFLSYREVRDLFLDFFKRHGHEIVEPRPVVARWREDLYLTIASIVVFQPHVTSGIVPPPANPLVIAQPCIRLEDIDNVGLTFGRHLTNFIMGGHHAFNYPDKRIYWTDETVEYAKEFFTKEIGIPEDELTYKESWWEGGGNAGPCFEVAVGGLELATLVFMMYKVENGSYSEIPIKIVDTGYGIERIAWFVQKTPTAFHAVYGPLVQEFHKALGILEPDKDLLYIAARLVARLQPSKPNALDEFFNNVASVLGIDKQEVENQLRPAIDVYALLDHTKTIALMLTDGIVPSNSGEGYLARLVIRRSLRRLHKITKDIRLSELVAKQLDYWSDMYPNMKKNKDRILEMVILEEEKFLDVVKKLSTIVVKYAKKVPTLEDLVLLYDSQGIPPDMLRDELERRYKVRIEIPQNFYSIVASRHSKPVVVREIEKKKLRDDVVSWASKFPETRRLFHEDPYIRIFKAKVLGVYENYLILDSTAFYPEGGGQLGDRGFIIVNGKKIKVIDTQKTNGVVVH